MDTRQDRQSCNDALYACSEWLLAQKTEDPFFRCLDQGKQSSEWYSIFYPLRTLLCAGQIFSHKRFTETVFAFMDLYVSEQLPNGAFTSNYRKKPTAQLTKAEFQDILRTGKANLADNGSNINALIQAAKLADPERRKTYLDAARGWLDACGDGGPGR